jgi:hypothetical protein
MCAKPGFGLEQMDNFCRRLQVAHGIILLLMLIVILSFLIYDDEDDSPLPQSKLQA